MNDQTFVYVCIVGAVTAVGFFLSRLFVSSNDTKLRQRLSDAQSPADGVAVADADGPKSNRAGNVLKRIGTAAAQPFMPSTREKQSTLRRQLGFAGVYAPGAIKVMTGAKVL